MGLQDVNFQMKLPFDVPAARELSRQISEEIYFHACPHPSSWPSRRVHTPRLTETRAAQSELQFGTHRTARY